MKKIIVILVVIIIIILGVKYLKPSSVSMNNVPDQNIPAQTVTNTPVASTTTISEKVFTMQDVNKHADAKSCWTAINDKVYDVTTWIDEHPGGRQAILGLCGKDGSQAFSSKHGGQPRPNNELANFLIGALKK